MRGEGRVPINDVRIRHPNETGCTVTATVLVRIETIFIDWQHQAFVLQSHP